MGESDVPFRLLERLGVDEGNILGDTAAAVVAAGVVAMRDSPVRRQTGQ